MERGEWQLAKDILLNKAPHTIDDEGFPNSPLQHPLLKYTGHTRNHWDGEFDWYYDTVEVCARLNNFDFIMFLRRKGFHDWNGNTINVASHYGHWDLVADLIFAGCPVGPFYFLVDCYTESLHVTPNKRSYSEKRKLRETLEGWLFVADHGWNKGDMVRYLQKDVARNGDLELVKKLFAAGYPIGFETFKEAVKWGASNIIEWMFAENLVQTLWCNRMRCNWFLSPEQAYDEKKFGEHLFKLSVTRRDILIGKSETANHYRGYHYNLYKTELAKKRIREWDDFLRWIVCFFKLGPGPRTKFAFGKKLEHTVGDRFPSANHPEVDWENAVADLLDFCAVLKDVRASKILLSQGWAITKSLTSWATLTYKVPRVWDRWRLESHRINGNKTDYFMWALSNGANFPSERSLVEPGNQELALAAVSRGMNFSKRATIEVCRYLDGDSVTVMKWWNNFGVRKFLMTGCSGSLHLTLLFKRQMRTIEGYKNSARNFLPLPKEIIEWGVNEYF